MNSRTEIKNLYRDYKEKRNIKKAREKEIKKFEDPRRVAIYNRYTLSKTEQEMIDDLYIRNYGEKIPYTWHRHYSAISGRFDVNYFPELLYIPEMQRFMNLWPEYCKNIGDKNILPIYAKACGIMTPVTIVSYTKDMFRNSRYEMITKEDAAKNICQLGELFVKPTVNTSSGRNCLLCSFKSEEEAISMFERMGGDFAVQEKLKNHDSLSKLYPNSINTFRVVTYRWKDRIVRTPSFLRIGKDGGFLDNAHAGGIFIAINDDGTLHETAYTEFGETFKEHPDTKQCFKDYKIDLFPKVLDAAEQMQQMIPQVGIIHWDFTIDEDGNPVVLEANVRAGGIWAPQISHGKGPFGDLTPEILQWMRFMKKQKVCSRTKYPFGKVV